VSGGASQSGKHPTGTLIRLEGWYPYGAAYPDISRYLLDDKVWKLTIKEHNLEDLELLPIERIQNSFFSPVHVSGVVNVNPSSGSQVPFFIRKEKVAKLKKLIDAASVNTTFF
jgi:hypothetical protein